MKFSEFENITRDLLRVYPLASSISGLSQFRTIHPVDLRHPERVPRSSRSEEHLSFERRAVDASVASASKSHLSCNFRSLRDNTSALAWPRDADTRSFVTRDNGYKFRRLNPFPSSSPPASPQLYPTRRGRDKGVIRNFDAIRSTLALDPTLLPSRVIQHAYRLCVS